MLRTDLADVTAWDEEHVEQADAFVALSDNEEHNILAAAHAKSVGSRMAIAVLQQPTYQTDYSEFNKPVIISPWAK